MKYFYAGCNVAHTMSHHIPHTGRIDCPPQPAMVKTPLHFLLTAKARTLSTLRVARMNDDDAFVLFKRLRWGDREEVA